MGKGYGGEVLTRCPAHSVRTAGRFDGAMRGEGRARGSFVQAGGEKRNKPWTLRGVHGFFQKGM